jgi:FtsZ-interacting cell division protein ZipA
MRYPKERKEAARLIQTVARINDRIVAEPRAFSLERIDQHIARVTQELDEVGASPELCNQCLYPIQQVRKQVESQPSIAHIFQHQAAAKEAAEEAINRIENAAQTVSAGVKESSPARQSDDPAAKVQKTVKKRHAVYPNRLVKKSYLETEQELDEFLAALRKEIEASIARGERVEVKCIGVRG